MKPKKVKAAKIHKPNDTHLSAAAPDLLEALEALVLACEHRIWQPAAYHRARFVIAQAKGENL
jgi:hypothetical protein